MKKLFTLFILLSLLPAITNAQGTQQPAPPQAPQEDKKQEMIVSVGPFVSLKAGINGGTAPQGRQNKIDISTLPDFGISSFIPLSVTKRLGLIVEFGYCTYVYRIDTYPDLVLQDFATLKYNYSFRYLAVATNLYFGGFTFGLNMGIPVSGSSGSDISTEKMSKLLEFRVGGIIPLFADVTGNMNLTIHGGYMLSGIFNHFGTDDPLKGIVKNVPPEVITDAFNPRAASLTIGFNYLFNL